MKKIIKSLVISSTILIEMIHADTIQTTYLTYEECDATLPTYYMFDCIIQETGRQDNKLNQVYKIAMKKLQKDKQRQNDLKTLQRIWIKYRDAKCNFYNGYFGGGTFEREVVLRCEAEITADRVEELEAFIDTYTKINP